VHDTIFDVHGRRALVTGSSRGLGLVLARALAERGCHVILNGRNQVALDEAAEQLRGLSGSVSTSSFDIVNEDEVAAAIARIESDGPIDILVNNAGIQIRGPLESFPVDRWREIVDVNLTGAFIVASHVARRMIARRGGKVINMCSVMSDLGRRTSAPYAATKGGLRMLTRAMAVDWAQYNIQVNAIGPGYYITEMTQPLADDPEFDAWLRRRTPAGRWGDPAELVGALILFSSAASDFMSGQLLFVDGGITAAL
jgi:gluconate 5-dehydrogenase